MRNLTFYENFSPQANDRASYKERRLWQPPKQLLRLGSRHSLNHTASRNTSEATARKRYVAGHGRCEYQRARVTTTIAPRKNRTRPVAAATPTRGTPMPIMSPGAPAALRAPSVNSQDWDPPHLVMLSTTHWGWRKSTTAAKTLAATGTIVTMI